MLPFYFIIQILIINKTNQNIKYIKILQLLLFAIHNPSMNLNKMKTLGVDQKIQTTQFAAFPLELEFNSQCKQQLVFQFEKGFQVLGKIEDIVNPQNLGSKINFTSINNLIPFRVFSCANPIYKWSVYKQHLEAKELEFIESCTLNIKSSINSFTANEGKDMVQGFGYLKKQEICPFPSLGVSLKFVLIIAESLSQIEEFVQLTYQQTNKQNNLELANSLSIPMKGEELQKSVGELDCKQKNSEENAQIPQKSALGIDDIIMNHQVDPKQVQQQMQNLKLEQVKQTGLLSAELPISQKKQSDYLKLESNEAAFQGKMTDPIDEQLDKIEQAQEERRTISSRQNILNNMSQKHTSDEQMPTFDEQNSIPENKSLSEKIKEVVIGKKWFILIVMILVVIGTSFAAFSSLKSMKQQKKKKKSKSKK